MDMSDIELLKLTISKTSAKTAEQDQYPTVPKKSLETKNPALIHNETRDTANDNNILTILACFSLFKAKLTS